MTVERLVRDLNRRSPALRASIILLDQRVILSENFTRIRTNAICFVVFFVLFAVLHFRFSSFEITQLLEDIICCILKVYSVN